MHSKNHYMNISHLTASQFKQAVSLLEKKEALQKQIDDIDVRVAGLFGGGAASGVGVSKRRGGRPRGSANKKPTATRAKREPGAKRGDLKIKVLAALKDAGDAGLSIKEMSDKLKTKGSNLYAWFGSTGKKVSEIQKVGPAKYKLVAAGAGN